MNRSRFENEFKYELLRGADVVCCTLNYSASCQLDVLRSGGEGSRSHFTCCIVDEVQCYLCCFLVAVVSKE